MPVTTSISEFCANRGVRWTAVTHPKTAHTAQEQASVSHVQGGAERTFARAEILSQHAQPNTRS